MSHTTALYDNDRKYLGQMDEDEGTVRDDSGRITWRLDDRKKTKQTDRMLADYFATKWNEGVSRTCRADVPFRDSRGQERIVKLDLAPTDVHVPGLMPGYSAGYQLAEGVADVVSPVVMSAKEEDKLWTWNATSSFQRAIPTMGAAGGRVNEVQPAGGTASYNCIRYALGAFVPTEVTANQDAPIDVNQKVTQRILEALKLEREIRVMTQATTTANFTSQQVRTLSSGYQWNGGASSQPVTDLQTLEHTSAMDISRWIMPLSTYDTFATNAAVQKFVAYKQGVQAVPEASVAALLRVAPITIARMKYYGATGTLIYVWPDVASASYVVGVRTPPKMPPSDQRDIATMFTARWAGGTGNGGEGGGPRVSAVAGGFMIRRFFEESRGSLGGQMVVVCHADAEVFTSSLVGGVIVNPIQ